MNLQLILKRLQNKKKWAKLEVSHVRISKNRTSKKGFNLQNEIMLYFRLKKKTL